MSDQHATPRHDAIKAELHRGYPDPIPEDRKLLYYMEAAECFGQECRLLEMELAERTRERETLHRSLIPAGVIHGCTDVAECIQTRVDDLHERLAGSTSANQLSCDAIAYWKARAESAESDKTELLRRVEQGRNAAQRILNALAQQGHPDYSLAEMLKDIRDNTNALLSAAPRSDERGTG